MRKICCVLIEPKGYERQAALNYKHRLVFLLKEKKLLDQDYTVEFKSLEKGLETLDLYMKYEYFEFLTTYHVVEAMIRAENEGFDAITVACFFDPGIEEVKSVLNALVVGIGKAALTLAHTLSEGGGIAIIATSNRARIKIGSLIERYGFKKFMLKKEPIRAIPTDLYLEASSKGAPSHIERLKETCIEVSKEFVDDGADVIVVGCGGLGPILMVEGLREVRGIPIVEPITAALLQIQTMLKLSELGVKPSRLYMPRISKEELVKGRNNFGFQQ